MNTASQALGQACRQIPGLAACFTGTAGSPDYLHAHRVARQS